MDIFAIIDLRQNDKNIYLWWEFKNINSFTCPVIILEGGSNEMKGVKF